MVDVKKGFEDAIINFCGSVDELCNTPVPSVDAVQEWKAYGTRTLYVDFEIGPFLGQLQKYIIQWNYEDLNKKTEECQAIKIFINSPGGYLSDCFAFIDILKLSKTPIKLICTGAAYSAAGYIFMTKSNNIIRYMFPHSKVLIHQGSVEMPGAQTTQFLDTANHVKNEEKIVKDFILSNTTIKESLYNKKRKVEWMIDAEQCLKLGICDKVIENFEEIR